MMTPAFVRMLTDAQFAVFSYILLLVGDPENARDILQNTNLAIMRSAANYEPGTPFLAWAKTLARFEVLTWRKKRSRDRLIFDDEVFQRLTDRLSVREEQSNRRVDALNLCLKKLAPGQRDLVTAKYYDGLSTQELSRRFKSSQASVVSMLYRIRKQLALCIATLLRKEAL